MSSNHPKITAIGLTFSNDTLHLLIDILDDPKFNFAAEGSMVSGYELYVTPSSARDAIKEIQSNPKLAEHKVEIYDRIRDFDDGTKYDRLIDHFEGEDPNRPSANGIIFEL